VVDVKGLFASAAVIAALIFGAPAAQADSINVTPGEIHIIGCFAPYDSVGFYRFGIRVNNQTSLVETDQPMGVIWSADWAPRVGGSLGADGEIWSATSRHTVVVNQTPATFEFRYTCSP
jgi:hypothetical protein